jgi:predicted nuclease with TOPRIM domain
MLSETQLRIMEAGLYAWQEEAETKGQLAEWLQHRIGLLVKEVRRQRAEIGCLRDEIGTLQALNRDLMAKEYQQRDEIKRLQAQIRELSGYLD